MSLDEQTKAFVIACVLSLVGSVVSLLTVRDDPMVNFQVICACVASISYMIKSMNGAENG